MESATRVYHKLSLILHPDKHQKVALLLDADKHGGSDKSELLALLKKLSEGEPFVLLKSLHSQWEAADSRAGTLAVELQTARETASRAQAELAHIKGDWCRQLAANTAAVHAQGIRWYQEKTAAMQKKHFVEVEALRSKLKYVSGQWQKSRLAEQSKVKELQQAHEERAASNSKRKRLGTTDVEEMEAKRVVSILEAELRAEKLSQCRIAGDWRAELVLREDAANKRESEQDERACVLENKIAEIQWKEMELEIKQAQAIDNEIKQAELAARSLRHDRECAEYEEKRRTEEKKLCDKAARLRVKEEELAFLLPAYEACAQLMQDYSAVDGAVKYLDTQRETLNREIERLVKKHASLAHSFQLLQAEVMAPPVEP